MMYKVFQILEQKVNTPTCISGIFYPTSKGSIKHDKNDDSSTVVLVTSTVTNARINFKTIMKVIIKLYSSVRFSTMKAKEEIHNHPHVRKSIQYQFQNSLEDKINTN